MKKYFLGIFIGVLLLVTYVTLPRVDYVEPNVFFYLEHLTPMYYLSLITSIIIAVFCKNRFVRIFSAVAFALLIIFTPSVILVNPWFMDTYPFMSEPIYIQRNGHLGNFHYISESPALGLIFGSYLLVTGINPLILQKIYPGFIAIILILLIYLIAEKMKINKKSLAIAPLCFVSIIWPNLLHFCRQSISLIPYLTSFFLLLQLIFHRSDRRIIVLLIMQIFILTLSHPATPIFFMANLATIAIIGRITNKIQQRELKLITWTLLISVLSWIWWNFTRGTTAIYNLTKITKTLIDSLLENPSNPSGVPMILEGRTPTYSLIIDIRLAMTITIVICAMLLSIAIYRCLQDQRGLVILIGWNISNIASSIPLIYSGLGYFPKPALFTFISWAPLGALFYQTLISKRKELIRTKKIKRAMRFVFLVNFIILPSLLIPVIKYAPLPFMYPPSRELASKSFLDLHWPDDGTLIYLELWTYCYSYNLYGVHDPAHPLSYHLIYHPNEGLNLSVVETSSLWITYRLVTRDAFWTRTPSYLCLVENATYLVFETTHNKIYDSGWPDYLLIATYDPTK